MTTQNYLIIESNTVTNVVLWDGNTETWTPPANSIQLINATTLTKVWEAVVVDKKIVDFELVERLGRGSIGFTWNGQVLTTNEEKPSIPTETQQPSTQGTQTL